MLLHNSWCAQVASPTAQIKQSKVSLNYRLVSGMPTFQIEVLKWIKSTMHPFCATSLQLASLGECHPLRESRIIEQLFSQRKSILHRSEALGLR